MSQLKKEAKYSWRKRLRLLMVGWGLYLIVVLSQNLREVLSVRGRVKEAKGKVEELEQEQARLKESLKEVESVEFVEQQIRDELMLAKPGETVMVVPKGTEDEGGEFPPSPEATEDTVANWQKWARLFGFL